MVKRKYTKLFNQMEQLRKGKIKTFRGIPNPKFGKIVRNRDDRGHILTYSTFHGKGKNKIEIEHNTIGQAKLMALKIVTQKKKRRSKK